ncbi:type IV pilus biogenesis/stability protein PilW [Thiofilum flexile]|uniref:type IV pilus biogenesis/stability protein PilW n=1 Tax=Thiofilum flexile TaxID=125627 RepID=UPI00037663F5|nr:type IV pilus biogenesis/stability protein PilW [Thiofilum flexile]
MKTSLRWLVISSVLVGVLSACSSTDSTTSTAGSSGGDAVKAASYNAQLGVGYLQSGRLDLAKEYLDKALKYHPQSVDANHYYALLQERLKDDASATRYFAKAVHLSKTPSPELMNNYGSHLCRVGQYDKAITAFKTALRDPLYRTPEFAYTNIGVCLTRKGHPTEAISYFHQALQANEDFGLALYQLAELNYKSQDYAKAQAFWFRYRDNAPVTPESLMLCTQIGRALNDTAQVEQCTQTLLTRFPNSAEAQRLN